MNHPNTQRHIFELLITPASDRFSVSQLVFSSATATFGGGSAASPWPPYALLAWPKAPWSRASVKRAVTCRRPWRGREVGEDARAHKHTPCLADVLCSEEPFDPVPLLNNAVANIICQIVFGRRFDYADHIFQSMLHHLTEMAYLEGSIWALVG